MEFSVERFSSHNTYSIALLHERRLPTGFISKCGMPFLQQLYRAIDACPYAAVFVAVDLNSKEIIGFVAGSVDTSLMYRWILLRKAFLFFVLLLPQVTNHKTIKYIFETLFYPFFKKKNRSPIKNDHSSRQERNEGSAELLSIAVDGRYEHRGIGKRLTKELTGWFKSLNQKNYKVVTFGNDKIACTFYETCGFALSKQFIHHGNLMHEYARRID